MEFFVCFGISQTGTPHTKNNNDLVSLPTLSSECTVNLIYRGKNANLPRQN